MDGLKITKRVMLLVYVALACVLAVIVGGASGIPTYWRLLSHGAAARATVERTACHAHGSVFFRFAAAGREYSGVGNAGYGTPECSQLKEGDQILAYYLPSDPAVSRPGEIRERWANQLIFFVLAVTLFPAAIVLVVWWRLPERFRATQTPR